MNDTMVRAPTAADVSFIDEVCSIPGGEDIRSCIQCGVCSGSCPTANRWDYPPRQVIALVRAGLRDELLSSNSMWFCASCYLCTVRCPRDIKPTNIMHALEVLAIRDGLNTKRSKTPVMYKAFVDSVRGSGRVYELGMMLKLFLKTNPFAAIKMAPLGLSLFLHRRMPLRPNRIKARGELKAILDKVKAMRGAQ